MESKAYVRLKYGKSTVKYGKSTVLYRNFLLAPTVYRFILAESKWNCVRCARVERLFHMYYITYVRGRYHNLKL